MKCRSLFAICAGVLASLAVAGPAVAAPGDGAQVVETHECIEEVFGTLCYDQRDVINFTEAGSGNLNLTGISWYEFTFTGSGPFEGCSDSTTGRGQVHQLLTPDAVEGEAQQYHFGSRQQFSGNCFETFDCTAEENFTYANGQVRHNTTRLECVPTV